jgi:amino acid transporter
VARVAPGWSGVLVFAGAALALAPIALAFAMLGRRFDEDGGPVVYARAAFGETASFAVGWVAYLSAVASAAAVTAGLATSVAASLGLEGPLSERAAAVALATALALFCAAGVPLSARTWTALTVLKLLPLVALVGALLVRGAPASAASLAIGVGQASWLQAALRVAFTYQGFEIVPVIASQVRSPARSVPLATLGSLGAAAFLYVGLHAACVLALPDLASSASPLVDAAAVYGGPSFAALVAWAATISGLGISLGMMVTTPRYLSALARGGSLPLGLDTMAPNGVPERALSATWVLVVALVALAGRGELFDLSSLAVLIQYVVTALALGALARRGERDLTRRHAWVALPAALAGATLAYAASIQELALTAGAVVVGFMLRRRPAAPAPASP